MQVEIKVPQLPESVAEGTLGDWHKQVGDSVDVDENIVDLETDKVVLEIVASKAGVIESIEFATGDTVKSGDLLGLINTEAVAAAPAAAEAGESASAGKAGPAVRKMLNENDLSVDDVQGSGKKRRHPERRRGTAFAAASGTCRDRRPNANVVAKADACRRANSDRRAQRPASADEPLTRQDCRTPEGGTEHRGNVDHL